MPRVGVCMATCPKPCHARRRPPTVTTRSTMMRGCVVRPCAWSRWWSAPDRAMTSGCAWLRRFANATGWSASCCWPASRSRPRSWRWPRGWPGPVPARCTPCQPGGAAAGQPASGSVGTVGPRAGGTARTVAGGGGLQRAAAASGRDAGCAAALCQQCRAPAAHALGGDAGGTGEFIAPARPAGPAAGAVRHAGRAGPLAASGQPAADAQPLGRSAWQCTATATGRPGCVGTRGGGALRRPCVGGGR